MGKFRIMYEVAVVVIADNEEEAQKLYSNAFTAMNRVGENFGVQIDDNGFDGMGVLDNETGEMIVPFDTYSEYFCGVDEDGEPVWTS